MSTRLTSDPVLDAARACVLDVGLRRTTLADVARRAGVSRMTLYRQYADRDEILATLLTAELVALVQDARARVRELPTARQQLVEAALLVAVELTRHALLRRVLDLDPELLLPHLVDRLGPAQRAVVDLVAEQVVQGRGDGSVRDVEPHVAAVTVVLTVQAFVVSARVAQSEGLRVDDELRRLLDGYLR